MNSNLYEKISINNLLIQMDSCQLFKIKECLSIKDFPMTLVQVRPCNVSVLGARQNLQIQLFSCEWKQLTSLVLTPEMMKPVGSKAHHLIPQRYAFFPEMCLKSRAISVVGNNKLHSLLFHE